MPDKQRGDVEFAYANGFFSTHSPFSGIQLYHLFEREITIQKSLPSVVNPHAFVLLFCMTGDGVLIDSNGQCIPFCSNTVVVAPASRVEAIAPAQDVGALRYICMNYDVMPVAFSMENDHLFEFYSRIDQPLVVEQAHFVRQCMSLFIAELCTAKSSLWMIMGYLDQLLILIHRAQCTKEDPSLLNSGASNAVGHTVYAIIRYIDEHLFTMNSLMDMARDLGYSYNYLSHVFRKKTGITIQAYVSQKKIERSTELLRNEHYSITEIAAMLNYDCIQSFSKAFRKVMHMSPTEYRAAHGINE